MAEYLGPKGPRPETLEKFNKAMAMIERGSSALAACRKVGLSRNRFHALKDQLQELGELPPVDFRWTTSVTSRRCWE